MPERNLNFDHITDRRNTKSLKWDFAARRGRPEDVLPLWVADMDFRTSSYVEDALAQRARHGIYGYSDPLEDYFPAVSGWMQRRHNWKPQEEWLLLTPGVVFALSMAVRAYTQPGDAVMIQEPVYYPFSEVIRGSRRRVISNDLVIRPDGRYSMDFDDMKRKIVENDIRLFFLCSPHNPVGRVWTAEELQEIGEICQRYNVIVASDEIHSDFVFQGTHHVLIDAVPELQEHALILTSPSKTFNLASLLLSNIFIPSERLRRRFHWEMEACGISQLSVFGLDACEAAYTKGENWYQGVKAYIAANLAFVRGFIDTEVPGIRCMPHEGTYLQWLDCRGLHLEPEELERLILEKAGLWLDSGHMFGRPGEGFQRINTACPRPLLEEAVRRLQKITTS